MSGKRQNSLKTSSNFFSSFSRHSLDAGGMNVGQKSKPFEHFIQRLFDICPTFVRRWSNECRANRLNASSKFRSTFVRHSFASGPVNVGQKSNRLNTSSNFCLTFVRHSFDAGRMNIGKRQDYLN